MTIPAPPAWADRRAALQAIYDQVISGTATGRVKFRAADGSERDVEYAAPNPASLQAEIRRCDEALARASGRAGRHAIVAGVMRPLRTGGFF